MECFFIKGCNFKIKIFVNHNFRDIFFRVKEQKKIGKSKKEKKSTLDFFSIVVYSIQTSKQF